MAFTYLPTGYLRRVTAASLVVVLVMLNADRNVDAQDPVIDRIDASNLRPGQSASVVVNGKQLANALSLWTPVCVLRPKGGQDLTKDQPVTMEGPVAAEVIPGIYPARFVTNLGCSEAAFVVIDDLASVAVAAESEDRKSGQLITLPCCINAHLNPVLSRIFRIPMAAGQTVNVEVFARRLGSDLDPVLRITGPDGREVAYRDDIPGAEGDTQLQYTAAADGEYRVEVRDVRYSGGTRHFFHLRIGKLPMVTAVSPGVAQTGGRVSLIGTAGEVVSETSPQGAVDSLGALVPVTYRPAESDGSALSSVLLTNKVAQPESEPNNLQAEATVASAEAELLTGRLQEKGDVDWFTLNVTEAIPLLVTAQTREIGSPADVLLELYNADGGKILENDDAGGRDAEFAAQLPGAGKFYLKVSEIAGRGGHEWTYVLDVCVGRKAVRVTAPVDRFNVPRGGSASMAMTVRRIHYDGPLRVEAVGLPAALQMAPFWLGAKQSSVPVVLTALDPAASSSDADWGPIGFRIIPPDGTAISVASVQLAPPAPKKTDAEIFRSARLRTDLFAAVRPVAQFSLSADTAAVTLVQGASATVNVRSTRAAEWTMPIEVGLAIPADQLPPGITVTGGAMAAGELPVTISATADAAVGLFTVFLQGKAKKDKEEPVHPVPAIVVEVKSP